MENKTLLQKIRSVKYCLMAHPHNEPDSEFADRIDDLQEIEDSLEAKVEQHVRKTLDECKDEVARKHEAISELDLIGSLIMSRNPEAIQDYVSEVATLYAQAKAVEPQQTPDGWVKVTPETMPELDTNVWIYDGEHVFVAYYWNYCGRLAFHKHDEEYFPTHWMKYNAPDKPTT